MRCKVITGIMLALLFIGMLTLAFNIQPVKQVEASTLTPHSPISINGNAGFVPANGVTGGSGTVSDPYIIDGWDIDLSITPSSGISVSNTWAYFVIKHVYIHEGNGARLSGIYLSNVTHAKIENVTVFNNYIGMEVEGCSSNKFLHNNVSSNGQNGIGMLGGSNNSIIGNYVSRNEGHGIYIGVGAQYCDISNNIVQKNREQGIALWGCNNNSIASNSVLNNSIGIYFRGFYGGVYGSSYNTVFSNFVLNNSLGILISSLRHSHDDPEDRARDNLIYNNCFINDNNAEVDTDDEFAVVWSNSWNISKSLGVNIVGGFYLGGNYFSDYTGNDTDGDNIGDVSYRIPVYWNYYGHYLIAYQEDYLPLIKPANQPPSTPTTPHGPNLVVKGFSWGFTSSATDPDGDKVSITFDWGDGTNDTVGPASQGTVLCGSHSWADTGMFEVRAKAIDIHGAESGWSSPLEVTVCVEKTSNWTGYVVDLENSQTPITLSVEAEWTQPTFYDVPVGSWQYTWIGVGGIIPHNRLLQAGIAVYRFLGSPWGDYVMVPFYMSMIGEQKHSDDYQWLNHISPGDLIHAKITSISSSQWSIVVEDLTKGTSWAKTVDFEPDLTSVEWVHEPGRRNGGIADFSPITFSEANYSVNNISYELGKIEPALNAELQRLLFPQTGNALTDVSLLSLYEHFTITYLGSGSIPAASTTMLAGHSSAYLNVYDSLGNHLGYNATSGFIDLQIPNSLYFVDEQGVQYAFLYEPDEYRIDLVGNATGNYHLHMQAFANGSETLDQWSNDTIVVNETKTYSLIHQVSLENLENPKTVIGEGFNSSVIAIIANNGNYTETFNVRVYANTTIVGTQLVTLASRNSTTITFTWNTTGVPYGKYTISAYVTPVPGETDLGDNTYTGGWVEVRLRGLVTPLSPTHTKVSLVDFGKLKLIYSQVYPYLTPPYDVNRPETYYYLNSVITGKPEYLMPDVNGDGKVTFADVGKEKLIYSGKL
jgi:parallel beta-helix repeat protein